MNNNIELDNSTSSNIYISDKSDTEIRFIPLPITDGNTPITDVEIPFHLTSSKRLSNRRTSTNPYRTLKYRNTGGFSISTLGLPYEYIRVSNLFDFLENVRIDCCPTLFADNRRGENRFIQTDVIAFDIDNFLPSHPEIFEDENDDVTYLIARVSDCHASRLSALLSKRAQLPTL